MSLPDEMVALLAPFAPLFCDRTWLHAQTLAWGAILAHGPRTVASALRAVGLSDERHFTNFHRVLNRDRWSSRAAARVLLGLLLALLPDADPVVVGVDDFIERRTGCRIAHRGSYRDPVASSHGHQVRCFGLRWVSMQLLVRLPWSRRTWGLPFLTVLARPPVLPTRKSKASRAAKAAGVARPKARPRPARTGLRSKRLSTAERPRQGLPRHKTTIDLAAQMLSQLRRWLPGRRLVAVADGAYYSFKLLRAAARQRVTLVTRGHWATVLHDDPPARAPGQRGRGPSVGARQPSFRERLESGRLAWEEVEVAWYSGERRRLEVASGTGLWSSERRAPVRVRWVISRDAGRAGRAGPRVELFVCTDAEASPEQILAWVVMRWGMEVTFEEARAHLGIQTQRQWSDRAIARTTPALLGLFSLVVLLTSALCGDAGPRPRPTAWYPKPEATFTDCMVSVRHALLRAMNSPAPGSAADPSTIPRDVLEYYIDQLARVA